MTDNHPPVVEKFTFFWNGPFSQWYESSFTIDDVEYNCCEQWMMANKALLFGDYDTQQAIMEATHPRDQKRLGRQVAGFDSDRWNSVARDLVYVGNKAKFQDEELKDILLATAGTTLVEASPYDKIWGIGLAEGDPRTLSRDEWLGTNWLGEVLTLVREDIMAGIERDDDFPWSM